MGLRSHGIKPITIQLFQPDRLVVDAHPSHPRHTPPPGLDSGASLWCRTLGQLALYAGPEGSRPLMQAGKPVAILVYLALAPPRRAERDHVAELFWPGVDISEARHSLRQSLYRLRQATDGAELVRARGTQLEFVPAVTLDGLEGERAAEAGELEWASELLRGNFLEGFSVPESHEFESWAEAQCTRFRECRARVLETLTKRHLEGGDGKSAQAVAEELLALRPLDDTAIEFVMRALVELGRHATAVARYEAYAELLRREVDEAPSDELQAYAGELDGYLKTRPQPSVLELPFVGRAQSWSSLEASWTAARDSRGSTVLIEGATGLGKTRLVSELRRRVEAADGLVLEAKCYEIERNVPYAAIAEALACAVARPELEELTPTWLAEVARLLPELRERFRALPKSDGGEGSQAAKRRLHGAIARYLEALSAGGPLLLAVDDIHWADPPSLEVLHFLSHRLTEVPVLQVATYRPAELAPEARRFARSLCSSRLASLLTLEPLTATDICELLNGLGDFASAESAAALAESLDRHSGGNPLILSELLEALDRGGVLAVRGGRWRLAPKAELEELPSTLNKLFADRIDALTPWMKALVETLAVAGDEVAVEVMARALDLSEPRAELALSVLQEERLVRRAGADTFELTHDELRRLVYQGVADERRALLHGAVGRALESLGEAKRPGGAARLAHHFDQAGELEKAHEYAVLAAGEARALSAPEVQRAHLELAAAHSPRALPPGSASEVDRRRRRRIALLAAGTVGLALAAGAVAGSFFYRPQIELAAGLADFRQGKLYLSTTKLSNSTAATHELKWGPSPLDLGRAEPLSEYPEDWPFPLFGREVTESNELHVKVFAVHGADTVQLTFGLSDDLEPVWSPDKRFILLLRGWKASPTHFQQNLFLLDSLGHALRPITDSRFQDSWPAWSPTGTQVAFRRDSAGVSTVWLSDFDGRNAVNLSASLGLPSEPGRPAFALDGVRLAIVYPDLGGGIGGLYIIDLSERTVGPFVPVNPPPVGIRPLWSPDGQWLAYVARGAKEQELWAHPMDGTSAPRLIAMVPDTLVPIQWSDGKPRYVAAVTIRERLVSVRTGRGARVNALATNPMGDSVFTPLRWSVWDTSVASVDDLGFVRGKAPGTTSLVASAGGFRADTVVLNVTFAPVEILFEENWTAGLDTTRWMPFGSPSPTVVEVATGRGPAFFNNGDYNHGSGAVSKTYFDVGRDGLTVEAEAWLNFTGQHWQNWQLILIPDTVSSNSAERGGGPGIGLSLSGHSPTEARAFWSCGSGLAGEFEREVIDPRWHRATLQVRPDGYGECYLNGTFLGKAPLSSGLLDRNVAVELRGQSEGTQLYHGRIVVRRGLRY